MMLIAIRSTDSIPVSKLIDKAGKELIKRFGAEILADEEELILAVDSLRMGFELAYEWRAGNPSLIAVLGSDEGMEVADRVKRLRFVLDLLSDPGLCIVGSANEKLQPFITDLEATSLGRPQFRDGLLHEEVKSYASAKALKKTGSLPGLELIDHNLPYLVDSFVGREKELAELPQLILDHAVTTLTGCGGTGKTRLALHTAAATALLGFEVVRFFRLADIPVGSNVGERMAEQAGIQSGLLEDFIKAYKTKEVLLLVDNCEHVVPSTREAIRLIVSELPRARVIATSREPLGLAGEQKYEVDPLGLPDVEEEDWIEHWEWYGALKMLDDRLREKSHDHGLTAENVDLACRICRRIDGLPLAIEHVAGQASVLGLKECERLLEESFDLLVSQRSDIESRHRTIRAAIDWSYRLLNKQERRLLENMSVFVGSFDREDIEEVCADEVIPQPNIRHLAVGLVNKSLVTRLYNDADDIRYQLLELVREYGAEKCGPRRDALMARWYERAAGFINAAFEYSQGNKDSGVKLSDLGKRYPAIHAALHWGVESGQPNVRRLCYQMSRYWIEYGPIADGLQLLTRVSSAADEEMDETGLDVAISRAVMLWLAKDLDQAADRLSELLVIVRERGDQNRTAVVLANLAAIALAQSKYNEAESVLLEAIELYSAVGDYLRLARSEANLCHVYRRHLGRPEEAAERLTEILERHGDKLPVETVQLVRLNRSMTVVGLDWRPEARAYLREMFEEEDAMRHGALIAPALMWASRLAANMGEVEAAGRLLGSALETFRDHRAQPSTERQEVIDSIVEACERKVSAEEWQRLIAKGALVPADRRHGTAIHLLDSLPI